MHSMQTLLWKTEVEKRCGLKTPSERSVTRSYKKHSDDRRMKEKENITARKKSTQRKGEQSIVLTCIQESVSKKFIWKLIAKRSRE